MNHSLIYPFVLNMWMMKRVDESFVYGQVQLGRLTEEEVEMILSTPQTGYLSQIEQE